MFFFSVIGAIQMRYDDDYEGFKTDGSGKQSAVHKQAPVPVVGLVWGQRPQSCWCSFVVRMLSANILCEFIHL